MKTLLFILFAFSCNAQEGMTQSEIYLINNDDKCDHAWITINTNPPFDECMKCRKSAIAEAEEVFYDPCINLSDLIEYERECYNDSTEYDCITIWFHDGDSYTGEYDADPNIIYFGERQSISKCWRHREPTFTGFITWLKNRIK